MNYCIKCGHKLKNGSKFCSKCGYKIKNEIKKEKNKVEMKQVKNEKNEKLLLIIGALLIIVSSIIFAFANWNEMTSLLKVLFLAIESLLFLSLALFSKNINFKTPYKFMWFIGISFIPVILFLIGYDSLLGNYLSFDGNGVYVYLSISLLLSGLIYYYSFKLLKSKVFLYFTYTFIYFSIIFIIMNFTGTESNIIIPITYLLNLIICIITLIIKKIDYKKSLNIFMSIVLFLINIITCVYTYEESNIILLLVTYLSYIISIFIIIKNSKKNILMYVFPILIFLDTCLYVNKIFSGSINLILFISLLSIILLNYLICLKNNKLLKILTYIYLIINIFILIVAFNVSNLAYTFVFMLLIGMYVYEIIMNDEKTKVIISKLLLPLTILLLIFNAVKIFIDINESVIFLITSLVCYTIFTIFNHKKKDNLIKIIFEIFSYIFLGFSSFLIIALKPLIFMYFLNELVWIYYFIYSKIVIKNKSINVLLLVTLLLNFMLLGLNYSLPMYYILLFISLITCILYFIDYKFQNKKTINIYFSIIFCSLASICSFKDISLIGVSVNVLLYVTTYYLAIKKQKIPFAIKFIYTLIGFILINSIFNYFIDKNLLVNILVLITYLIIIISMFLLQVDDDRKVLSYSFVILFPYINILNSLSIISDYKTSFIVFIIITLVLIYFEKVFKLREKEKVLFEIIILGLLHLVTFLYLLIFNFIISAFYIFYGFYKKRQAYIILGTVLLLINLIIQLYRIIDNIPVTFVLLIIGVAMLAYVFYMESKKKNKN